MERLNHSTFTARLIMRKGTGDASGKCVGYEYSTILLRILDCDARWTGPVTSLPEVIGAEWMLTSDVDR